MKHKLVGLTSESIMNLVDRVEGRTSKGSHRLLVSSSNGFELKPRVI